MTRKSRFFVHAKTQYKGNWRVSISKPLRIAIMFRIHVKLHDFSNSFDFSVKRGTAFTLNLYNVRKLLSCYFDAF